MHCFNSLVLTVSTQHIQVTERSKSIKIVLPFIAYFVRLTGIENCGSKILNRLLFPRRFSFYKHFCAFLLAILGNKISSRSNGIGRFPRSLLFSMFAFKEFKKHLKGLHGMGITNLVLSFNLHFTQKFKVQVFLIRTRRTETMTKHPR